MAHACSAGTSMTSYRLTPAAVAAISVATPARRCGSVWRTVQPTMPADLAWSIAAATSPWLGETSWARG